MSFIKVLLCPTAELARAVDADVSVEAEYGSYVAEGSILTLAHHQAEGPYSAKEGARAPCCAKDAIASAAAQLSRVLDNDGHLTIKVSHLDLDTVGGVLRTLAAITELKGDKAIFADEFGPFWDLAEFVDVSGPHKAHLQGAPAWALDAIHAYWAWNRAQPRTRYEDVTDVTDQILTAGRALWMILVQKDEDLLAAGRKAREDEARLNEASFVEMMDGVIVRASSGFVNHLYTAPGGEVGRAVVAFNTVTGAVTISLESPVEGVSCREIVQKLWGGEAGGHAGIAGSPRGVRMWLGDLVDARDALMKALRA